MSTEAIRLHFESGLHIGRGADELDKTATTYSSDAIKSALFAIGLSYYPDWGHDAKAFFEGFRISSAFPYCGEDYFLPKPVGMTFDFENGTDLTEAKIAKKIAYISNRIFKQWTQAPENKIKVSERQVGDGIFLFDNPNAKKFLFTTVQQRVAVPIEGGDARPYYFERLFFSEDAGLYFLISFTNEALREQILHALQLLCDAGIGTDRTVGNGQFNFDDPQTFDLPSGNSRGLQMALGLYLPTEDELQHTNLVESNWSLIKRGGYMAASQDERFRSLRKNSIYFFGEGSSFKTAHKLKGNLVDLQPKWDKPGMHPVWRCGMPIFINL